MLTQLLARRRPLQRPMSPLLRRRPSAILAAEMPEGVPAAWVSGAASAAEASPVAPPAVATKAAAEAHAGTAETQEKPTEDCASFLAHWLSITQSHSTPLPPP